MKEETTTSKIYYNISEVSELTGIKPYVLRYWETEFPELKPIKDRANRRLYRQKDIEIINLIKKMLYQEKYTIKGAKSKLAERLRQKAISDTGGLNIVQKRIVELIEEIEQNIGEVERLGIKA